MMSLPIRVARTVWIALAFSAVATSGPVARAAALFGTLALPAMGLGEAPGASSETFVESSEARKNEEGFLVHHVRSEYQSGPTQIKVLLPDRLEEGRRYAVLYVLPVEAGEGTRWGDGLVEVKKHDLHNRHRLICVLPTFSHLPWYADHPTDPGIRQESHFVRVVVPFVERSYPAIREPEGRLLVGFSKSGWGAFSLLLRNPQLFGKAAAWDAPLVEESPSRFGMGPIFGTRENFEHYRISALLETRAGELRGVAGAKRSGAPDPHPLGLRFAPAPATQAHGEDSRADAERTEALRRESRLVLTGYDNFRADHVKVHEQLVGLGIPHVYRDGPHREHQWHSGWLPKAVELLVNPNALPSSEREPR